jgi:hypothetical protein
MWYPYLRKRNVFLKVIEFEVLMVVNMKTAAFWDVTT